MRIDTLPPSIAYEVIQIMTNRELEYSVIKELNERNTMLTGYISERQSEMTRNSKKGL